MIRPGAIGDLIVSLPALEFLRADYTEVWVAGPNVPLVRFADRVRSISSTGLDALELGRAPASLMTHLASFDSIVSWYGATREEFRRGVQGLPIEFHQALPDAPDGHATDFYLRQVGAPLGANARIEVPRQVNEEFVAIHPFSGGRQKNWPLQRFRELAMKLGDVRFSAGPEEALRGAIRFDDLFELACWLKRAALYVGNDSGITHLAAAVGMPTVALFGPSNPGVWAPRGQNVKVLRHQPLEELSVDCVYELAASIRL